ncbi:sensor histidine kinase [Congregibacter litoralis]|nr:HAMP domain-containing sensor histidine kinase [Congregibacter litoralis]
MGDAVFYTFSITIIAVSAAVILAYREFQWMAYVALFSLLLLSVASMDGNLAYLLGGGDFVVWVVPFLLLSSTTAIGFIIVSARIELHHPLARFKPGFKLLALISACFPASCVFWLGNISLAFMWLPVNLLFFLMLVSQALPPMTWSVRDPLQRRLTRFFPLGFAGIAIAIQVVHYTGEGLSQARMNELNRFTALLYAMSSLAAVVWQIVANTREKLKAERQVLEAERNEAQLQLALSQARSDYQDALTAASQHRSRLATVSHDLKQPVIALRHAVDQMQRAGQSDDAGKLSRAIDYIASLSHAYVGDDSADTHSNDAELEPGDSTSGEAEAVDVQTFAQMLEQMFSGQAEEQGVRLRVVCAKGSVLVEPLPMMRVMTNLVSNALAHAQAKRIVVGFRRRGAKMVFQVHDDGAGIDSNTLETVLEPGVKGMDSDGQGLGLGIVSELCRSASADFRLLSREGKGTSAYVSLPMID